MKMKLFDNININASTAGTAAPQRRRVVFHPFLENCVRFAVSASFSAICQVKHVKYQKQVLINGGMLPAKREEGGGRRKSADASVQQLHVRWEHASFPASPQRTIQVGVSWFILEQSE